MIQPLEHRGKGLADVGEIADPAELRIYRSFQMHLDLEGVPMQARALVTLRHMGQTMGGFDAEFLEDLHGGLDRDGQLAGERFRNPHYAVGMDPVGAHSRASVFGTRILPVASIP